MPLQINYSYDIWKSWSTTIYFPNWFRVGDVSLPTYSISLNDPGVKARESGMVVYLMEISDPKFLFFSRRTRFQQCMFKRIHWIPTSSDGPIKISYNRCLYVKVHYALIEYENVKAKPTHYLVQLVDLDNPRDQQ